MKQLCHTETDPSVILICKLQDICSIERHEDRIGLKSHVSYWQLHKSFTPENRLYFIDRESKQCILSFYYLGSKILLDDDVQTLSGLLSEYFLITSIWPRTLNPAVNQWIL